MTWLTLFELADMCGGTLRGITDEQAGALNIERVERDIFELCYQLFAVHFSFRRKTQNGAET